MWDVLSWFLLNLPHISGNFRTLQWRCTEFTVPFFRAHIVGIFLCHMTDQLPSWFCCATASRAKPRFFWLGLGKFERCVNEINRRDIPIIDLVGVDWFEAWWVWQFFLDSIRPIDHFLPCSICFAMCILGTYDVPEPNSPILQGSASKPARFALFFHIHVQG